MSTRAPLSTVRNSTLVPSDALTNRITVPIPYSPQLRPGLEQVNPEAQFPQVVKLVNTSKSAANDDDVVVELHADDDLQGGRSDTKEKKNEQQKQCERSLDSCNTRLFTTYIWE